MQKETFITNPESCWGDFGQRGNRGRRARERVARRGTTIKPANSLEDDFAVRAVGIKWY